MKTVIRYAIRYMCPDNLAEKYFGSERTRLWVCGISTSFAHADRFQFATLAVDLESCNKYIKQHDMVAPEIVQVVVQVPE